MRAAETEEKFRFRSFILGNFSDRFCFRIETEKRKTEGRKMKGFYTKEGFCGLVDGRYVLFASESDYYETMEEAA